MSEKIKGTTFRLIGASNHADHDRQVDDFYATDPVAAELLLVIEPQLSRIYECACGEGHLAKVFDKYGKLAKASDIVNRGYGEVIDFLKYHGYREDLEYDDIVTNPPYKYSLEFVEHALECVRPGRFVCMFLKIQFLEGQKRKHFFLENPPVRVWVSSARIKCAINGDFDANGQSAACYAWYVWQKGYKGKTELKWFN